MISDKFSSSSSVRISLVSSFLQAMGISFSNLRRDRRGHRYHNQTPRPRPPPPPPYYYSDPTSQQPPPQPPHSNENGQNLSLPPPPPPPSQPPPQVNYVQNRYYCPHRSSPYISGYHQNMRPFLIRPTPVPQPPLPYVEHQRAKKVRNDVNVHKDTVRLEADDLHPGYHLVSFVFDASFDGSFTITFFGKEEEKNWTIVPRLPEAFPPTKVPFKKGTAQKFLQPPGTGIDLGFFSLDDLSKPSPEEVYPLVITAETVISPNSNSKKPLVHQQITQAVLEKTGADGSFKGKVMKQILLFEGARYELHELYGIDNSTTQGSASSDLEDKECVICLTEQKDTAIMPCRHLCLCSNCAKELRFQTNKCPICREPIKELIVIKVESRDEQL